MNHPSPSIPATILFVLMNVFINAIDIVIAFMLFLIRCKIEHDNAVHPREKYDFPPIKIELVED